MYGMCPPALQFKRSQKSAAYFPSKIDHCTETDVLTSSSEIYIVQYKFIYMGDNTQNVYAKIWGFCAMYKK